jgi:hypothetical protein
MNALYGHDDDPTSLSGEVASTPYVIRGLDHLLPTLLRAPMSLYVNPDGFRPAVERMVVAAHAPDNIIHPENAVVEFVSALHTPSNEHVSYYLLDALSKYIYSNPTADIGGSQHFVHEVADLGHNGAHVHNGKYSVMDRRGETVGTILTLWTGRVATITDGSWVEKDGLLVRAYKDKEVKNIHELRDRLKTIMDLSSFVMNILITHYRGLEELPPPSEPKRFVPRVEAKPPEWEVYRPPRSRRTQ